MTTAEEQAALEEEIAARKRAKVAEEMRKKALEISREAGAQIEKALGKGHVMVTGTAEPSSAVLGTVAQAVAQAFAVDEEAAGQASDKRVLVVAADASAAVGVYARVRRRVGRPDMPFTLGHLFVGHKCGPRKHPKTDLRCECRVMWHLGEAVDRGR